MHEWLTVITENAVSIINAMALVLILFGTLEAFVAAARAIFNSSRTGHELRVGYMRFARWLVAGLTFQLAADIIETTVAPGWEDVGRLAAIAVIRTFLSYFLERDMKEVNEEVSGSDEQAARKETA